jgi:hypothetical protein
VRHKLLQCGILSTTLIPAGLFADDANQCAGLSAVGGGCDATGLPNNINTIIDTLFTVAGAVAVIILVVGGIRYITSTGDSQRIKAAKDTILYAIIGLVVVIVARAIVGFVAGSLS